MRDLAFTSKIKIYYIHKPRIYSAYYITEIPIDFFTQIQNPCVSRAHHKLWYKMSCFCVNIIKIWHRGGFLLHFLCQSSQLSPSSHLGSRSRGSAHLKLHNACYHHHNTVQLMSKPSIHTNTGSVIL